MENKFTSKLIHHSTQLYLGWVLFIALLTLLPGQLIPNIIDWNFLSLDKIIHFTVFAILTILGGISMKLGKWQQWATRPVLTSILVAIAYGTTLEFTQSLVPQRTFDYADLTANLAGSVAGTVLFLIFDTKIRK